MKAINTLINKLNEVFSDMDAEVLEQSKKWAKDRTQDLKDFKVSEEYKALRKNTHKKYERLYEIAGGKTWYNVFNNTSSAMIEDFMTKKCAAAVVKRNNGIAKKLEKAGVSEVISEMFHHTNDGFNGTFVVDTDSGRKTVTVETVLAGGYNIQCLHQRVLVKVK